MSICRIRCVSYWMITIIWSQCQVRIDRSSVFIQNNLTRIDQPPSPIFTDTPYTVVQQNGAYYVGCHSFIYIVDCNNLTVIGTISPTGADGLRDIIFLNNGQYMIVTSTINQRLLFFNRSDAMSYNYDFIGYQNVSYPNPHGLFYVNDTFFYVTSWANNTAYGYSNAGNITSWTETLVVNAWPTTGSSDGNHVSVDNDGRYWFSLGQFGIKVFNRQGASIDTLKPTNSSIFDTLITDNYVIYLSDKGSNRIIRIDPNLQC